MKDYLTITIVKKRDQAVCNFKSLNSPRDRREYNVPYFKMPDPLFSSLCFHHS